MSLPHAVRIVEVGPRDGLQNEPVTVPTAFKAALIRMLRQAGLRTIEVGSFVSPRWVPQMADTAEIMLRLPANEGGSYPVLVPNLKGFEAAQAAGASEIAIFASASETFSQKNINCSIAESLERFAPVIAGAHAAGVKVRAALSCSLGCPYEGEITADQVEAVVKPLRALGVDAIDIADTIGVGTPRKVQAAMERALKHFPLAEVSGHFHDTYGQALSNVYASMEVGVRSFHASVAGLGGCPYAKGATGNVATEDVVFLLNGLGIATGIDLDKLVDAGAFISGVLGRPPVSRVARALLAKRAG
jgi:hydroxymethylglutaryl-CoA lyase